MPWARKWRSQWALLDAKILAGTADVDKEAVKISQKQAVEKAPNGDDVSDDGECHEADDLCAVYDVEWSIGAFENASQQNSKNKLHHLLPKK